MPSLNYVLQLALGSEKIDFIEDSGGVYFLLDSTFAAPPPKSIDVRTGSMRSGGSRILARRYENRSVSFACMIKGATTNAVIDSYNALCRLVERGSSDKATQGGIYNQGSGYEAGGEVGEDGLILRAKLKSTGGEDRITFRVVSGTVEIPGYYGVGGIGSVIGGRNAIESVLVTLECEPYAMGAPVSLAAQGQTVYGPPATTAEYDPAKKRFVSIAASEVKGDGPAPIKFVEGTNVSTPSGYNGLILARESGQGIIHCPGVPIQSGAGSGRLWAYGSEDRGTIKRYKVQIDGTGTPNTFKWSIDNGSTWVATGVSITTAPITLGAYGVRLQFSQTTGYTLNQSWSFKNDQSYFPLDANNASIDLSSRSGTAVAAFYVNVPFGHTGRYKVALGVSDGASTTEWNMSVGYTIPFDNGFTGSMQAWVGGASSTVYPGVLDVTRENNPIARYPGANTAATVTVFARRRNPADTSVLNIKHAVLVPVESGNSFIMYALGAGTFVFEDYNTILCGYDPRSPVIGMKTNSAIGEPTFMPLGGEYIGDVPVLEPGVDQSLYVIPTFGPNAASSPHNSAYVDVDVLQYRPRYLNVG